MNSSIRAGLLVALLVFFVLDVCSVQAAKTWNVGTSANLGTTRNWTGGLPTMTNNANSDVLFTTTGVSATGNGRPERFVPPTTWMTGAFFLEPIKIGRKPSYFSDGLSKTAFVSEILTVGVDGSRDDSRGIIRSNGDDSLEQD